MRWSIRAQLLIPLLTLLLGVVGISTRTAIASAQRARRQIEGKILDIAGKISRVSFPRNEETLQLMRGLSQAEFLLDRGDGDILSTLGTTTRPEGLPEPAPDARNIRLGPPVAIGSKTYLSTGVRLRPSRGEAPILYIFYPESLWRDALWVAIEPSLILGSFAGLASLLLAVALGQRLSRRIQELERRTRLIAAGDFSPMPLPGRNDELRDLGVSVNDMAHHLARLQETVQQTERFRLLGQVSGGLAHQLRNGVTGARLAVQLHARECTGPADAEALAVALRQLALVEAHLKRFLDLGNRGGLARHPLSLTALLEETIGLLRPQCRHSQIDLRWQPPPEPLAIQGDAGALNHLVLNVIANAIEAAGPGGWVAVSVHIKANRAIIEVADSGPGPPANVADRLFEPFVTGKPEGVGLGLAVSRQVAEAHGGRIHWHREADRTCFLIELPMEKEPPKNAAILDTVWNDP